MIVAKPNLGVIFSIISLLPILLAACTESGETSLTPTSPIAAVAPQAVATDLPPLGTASLPVIGDAPNPAPNNEAVIDTVTMMMPESLPSQVSAVVKGKLPDGCVTIERISQTRSGNTFVATIITNRQPDAGCIAQLQPFQQILPLDVAGLPPGGYTVTVSGANSVSTTFQLSGESPPLAPVTPSPPPAPPSPPPASTPVLANAVIGGVVWADFCRLLANGAPSVGCIPDGRGGFRADGTYTNGEARIAGVQVTLSRGGCAGAPAVVSQTFTDPNGFYRFDHLEPGPYCVAIETQVEPNLALLLPGDWTYPAPGVGRVEVSVGPDENKNADFGWDDQFDRVPPSPGDTSCVDQAAYVTDVSIPDNSPLAPGASFVKTWRLRNSGTCVWGSDYALVFVSGEPMGGQAPAPLPQPVQPGNEVDLSISLVAPANPGVYRGEWKLQNGMGMQFGSRGNYPFYVQIVVDGLANPPTPPVSSISGVVWAEDCRILEDGSPSGICILDGTSGAYRGDGLFNNGEIGLAGVQVKLSVGECPGNNFVFTTTTTDASGAYHFTGLQPGPHCVSVDTLTEPNASLLLPGAWTYPAPGVSSATVIADPAQSPTADFGWDYQLQ
ncbi:MAG: hypothetical protein BroJett011_53430 [Chloroflexota bacterium]|nr:MAG: hypothetical protein BroJett011_53430 [Chloroflexota bacterium]